MEDEVVTEGFLLPRKTSARQLEERSQGARRIRSSPSPQEPALAGAGWAVWETEGPRSCGKGLPGTLGPWTRGCRELNAENCHRKGRDNWRLVSQRNHCLIRQASIEWLLCSRHGAVGQKKQGSRVFCPQRPIVNGDGLMKVRARHKQL